MRDERLGFRAKCAVIIVKVFVNDVAKALENTGNTGTLFV